MDQSALNQLSGDMLTTALESTELKPEGAQVIEDTEAQAAEALAKAKADEEEAQRFEEELGMYSFIYNLEHDIQITSKEPCVPISEASTHLKHFIACDKKYDGNDYSSDSAKFIKACKIEFMEKICDAQEYKCVPKFAGDCEGLDGVESVCYGLLCYHQDEWYISEFTSSYY